MSRLATRDATGIVCIFAKPPVPGQVKTRLAAEIGDRAAAQLARAFLFDTCDRVAELPAVRAVIASTAPAPSLFPPGAEVWLQGEGDLGARLHRMLRRGLEEGGFVIAIGADSPGLPLSVLGDAVAALGETDAVLGPADDGGFYLLGLRRLDHGLLEDLPWSAPATFDRTAEQLRQRGYEPRILQPWFDIDVASDLQRLWTLLASGQATAPHTASTIAALKKAGDLAGLVSPVRGADPVEGDPHLRLRRNR